MKALPISAQCQAMLLHEQLHFRTHTTQHTLSWGTHGHTGTQSSLRYQKDPVTPGSPCTAASLTHTLANYLCSSAIPQQPANSFSKPLPTAADAEQEPGLAPVPAGHMETSAMAELQMCSKVRQSSAVHAPLHTGWAGKAAKPIHTNPFAS